MSILPRRALWVPPTPLTLSFLAVLFLLAILLCTFLSPVDAHSTAWPTIVYSESIQSLQHEILPRLSTDPSSTDNSQKKALKRNLFDFNFHHPEAPALILKDDRVRIQLAAFNRTFYLHLEPNLDLLHPEMAVATSTSFGGVRSEKVVGKGREHEIQPFKGVVVEDEALSWKKWDRAAKMSLKTGMKYSSTKLEHMLYEEGVVGWARMMVEHDEKDHSLILRGAFTVGDDTYHVTSRQHYRIQKRADDHTPPSHTSSSSRLIIYRDSDLYKPGRSLQKRGQEGQVPIATCGTATPEGLLNTFSSSSSKDDYYYPPNQTSIHTDSGIFGPRLTSMMGLEKRQEIAIKVAGPNPIPTGCPTERLINYMGVAADCTYVRAYGGLDEARKQILADFNTASAIYESTFNVALGVLRIELESMNCPTIPEKGKEWNQECSNDYSIHDRLSDFSFWRGQSTRQADGAGLWHLLTKCSSGPILGIAWTGALCQMSAQSQGKEYTSGTGVSSISPNEWMVVAHEIGHGFGAQHDCTAGDCADAEANKATGNTGATSGCCPMSTTTCDAEDHYIMNPTELAATKMFSPCSIKAICSTIATGGKCLASQEGNGGKIRVLASTLLNVCGNGIKEAGEQCDCGSPEECAKDPCCDGTTCRLKGNAVCDDLNDDCCTQCQLTPAGKTCRSAISSCDVPEMCTGTSPSCPEDIQIPNLTPCTVTEHHSNGTAYNLQGQCADGHCTSRDIQCADQQREGITRQCAAITTECELLCNDPNSADTSSCVKIPGAYFIDGSPCGSSGTGTCESGRCILPGGWARNHLQILIPIVVLTLLALAGGTAWFMCLRHKKKKHLQRVANSGLSTMAMHKTGGGPSSDPARDGGANGGGGAGSGSSTSGAVANERTKDAAVVDVPRWMMTNDRRASQGNTITRRSSVAASQALRVTADDYINVRPPTPLASTTANAINAPSTSSPLAPLRLPGHAHYAQHYQNSHKERASPTPLPVYQFEDAYPSGEAFQYQDQYQDQGQGGQRSVHPFALEYEYEMEYERRRRAREEEELAVERERVRRRHEEWERQQKEQQEQQQQGSRRTSREKEYYQA